MLTEQKPPCAAKFGVPNCCAHQPVSDCDWSRPVKKASRFGSVARILREPLRRDRKRLLPFDLAELAGAALAHPQQRLPQPRRAVMLHDAGAALAAEHAAIDRMVAVALDVADLAVRSDARRCRSGRRTCSRWSAAPRRRRAARCRRRRARRARGCRRAGAATARYSRRSGVLASCRLWRPVVGGAGPLRFRTAAAHVVLLRAVGGSAGPPGSTKPPADPPNQLCEESRADAQLFCLSAQAKNHVPPDCRNAMYRSIQ